MKRILVLLFILEVSAFGIEYNTYEMNVKHEFNASYRGRDSESDFAVEFGTQGPGPYGPSIYFFNENLVVSDEVINRTIYLNDDFSFNEIKDISFSDSIVYKMDNRLLGVSYDGITIIKNWEYESVIDTYSLTMFKEYKSILYINEYIFIHDKEGVLWAINKPSMGSNLTNLLSEEETIKLIQNGLIDNLTVDSKKRLFLDGKLQTLDYKTFYEYYKSLKPGLEKLSKLEFQVTAKTSSMMDYISTDKDDNSYWVMGHKYICIFDNEGLLFEFFEYDRKKSSTYPAVSPEGDVYFMKHGEDKVTLYKIERQW